MIRYVFEHSNMRTCMHECVHQHACHQQKQNINEILLMTLRILMTVIALTYNDLDNLL